MRKGAKLIINSLNKRNEAYCTKIANVIVKNEKDLTLLEMRWIKEFEVFLDLGTDEQTRENIQENYLNNIISLYKEKVQCLNTVKKRKHHYLYWALVLSTALPINDVNKLFDTVKYCESDDLVETYFSFLIKLGYSMVQIGDIRYARIFNNIGDKPLGRYYNGHYFYIGLLLVEVAKYTQNKNFDLCLKLAFSSLDCHYDMKFKNIKYLIREDINITEALNLPKDWLFKNYYIDYEMNVNLNYEYILHLCETKNITLKELIDNYTYNEKKHNFIYKGGKDEKGYYM